MDIIKDSPIFAVIMGWRRSSGPPVLLLFSFLTILGAWFPRAGVLVSRLLLGARLEGWAWKPDAGAGNGCCQLYPLF